MTPNILKSNSLLSNQQNRDVNVLVFGEMGLVRSFGEAGWSVFVGVGPGLGKMPRAYSRYCREYIEFPDATTGEFIEALVKFGQRQDTKTYIATDSDHVVLAISEQRHRLSEYFLFLMPDHSVVNALIDKTRFSEFAHIYSIPVPRSFAIGTSEDLENALQEISFPCIIKPAQREDWLGSTFTQTMGKYTKALFFEDRGNVVEAYNKLRTFSPDVVLQEYVRGDDRQLYDLHALFDSDGNLASYVLGRKIRTFPIHFGIGCHTETVIDHLVANVGLDALKKINFKGLANINLKKDSVTGEVKILEINPRSSFWCYLDAYAGNNLSVKAMHLVSGKEIQEDSGYRVGARWVFFKNDFNAFLQYRRAGEWNLISWLGSFRGDTAFHRWSLRDPLPFVVGVYQFAGRMFKRMLTRAKSNGVDGHPKRNFIPRKSSTTITN